MGRTRKSVAMVGIAAAAVLSVLGVQPEARAAPAAGPGVWVQLSSGGGIWNIDEPAVHRFGKTLQVVWTQTGRDTLNTRILNANGTPASPATTVLTWAALAQTPAVIPYGSQRMIVFAGQQDANSANPYSAGYTYYLTSPDGLTWTLGNGTLGSSSADEASEGSDAVNAGGTPISVATPGTSNDVSVHVGLDSLPPATPDQKTQANPQCCAYFAGVGYDANAHDAWTAWYSNSGTSATEGIDAQQIYPTAGPLVHAPQSATVYAGAVSSVAPDQRVQVAARSGGGLFTAYGVGYPTQNKVALWRLGSAKPLLISPGYGIAFPGVAAAPGGKLWVFWWKQGSSTLYAARTNAAGTVIGRSCAVRTPKSTSEVWSTAGDGSTGRLDLVVNAGSGSSEQIYSTQVLPCLTVGLSRTVVSYATGATVTVTVKDAGAAVRGVRLRYGNVSKTTNARGQASFAIAKHTRRGVKTITYSDARYAGGSVQFRVR